MSAIEWTLTDRIYLAIIDLTKTDRFARQLQKRLPNVAGLYAYAASVEKNPNQTQLAQRIYARAIADRLDGK